MINKQWALALSCWMYLSRNKTIPTLNCSKQHLWICLSNRLMSFWNVHFIPLLLWAPKSKYQLVPLWSVIKKSVPLFKFGRAPATLLRLMTQDGSVHFYHSLTLLLDNSIFMQSDVSTVLSEMQKSHQYRNTHSAIFQPQVVQVFWWR